MTQIYVVTEDALSEAVVEKIVEFIDNNLEIGVRMRNQGSGYLRQKLPQLIKLAESIPVLMLTDLDRVECAPTLRDQWFAKSSIVPKNLLFRVAVREVEAWLLADQEAFSAFARVPAPQVPDRPDELDDPKQTLLNLVRRYAKRDIKDAVLPRPGTKSPEGIAYNPVLIQYAKEIWEPERAAQCSDSLARVMPRLRSL